MERYTITIKNRLSGKTIKETDCDGLFMIARKETKDGINTTDIYADNISAADIGIPMGSEDMMLEVCRIALKEGIRRKWRCLFGRESDVKVVRHEQPHAGTSD